MQTGIVKFYNTTKGFGFIINDSDKKEIFVHASGLTGNVRENDRVTFETKEGKKGINAINVKKA